MNSFETLIEASISKAMSTIRSKLDEGNPHGHKTYRTVSPRIHEYLRQTAIGHGNTIVM